MDRQRHWRGKWGARRLTLGALVAASALLLAACGSDATKTGTLHLALVDASAPGVSALNVTFDRVEAHQAGNTGSDAGWETVNDAVQTFDLLSLANGVQAALGEAPLPAGHYTQLRLHILSAQATVGATTTDVTIPSGLQSGLKLVHAFTIEPDAITSLTLDFDATQSLVAQGAGQYLLQPTIRVVATVLSGSVSGTVTPPGIGAMVSASDANGPVTSTQVDPATGAYKLSALLATDDAGNPIAYTLTASAPGYTDGTETGVTATAGQDSPGHDFTLSP